MPPGLTLDWVGRLAERERPGLQKQFINAGPGRSRRASAHPPLSRAASPASPGSQDLGVGRMAC